MSFPEKCFYDILEEHNIDKKFLILETLPEPTTYEEKIMVNSLYEINKSGQFRKVSLDLDLNFLKCFLINTTNYILL